MEDIREVAWKGDLTTLRHLVEYLKLDVNQPHAINGTTRTRPLAPVFRLLGSILTEFSYGVLIQLFIGL